MTTAARMKWHVFVTFEATCISCVTVNHLWAETGRIGWMIIALIGLFHLMSMHPTDELLIWGVSQFLCYPEGSTLQHYRCREWCCTALHVQGVVLYSKCPGGSYSSGVGTVAAVATLATTLFGCQGSQAASSLHQSHMQLHANISD